MIKLQKKNVAFLAKKSLKFGLFWVIIIFFIRYAKKLHKLGDPLGIDQNIFSAYNTSLMLPKSMNYVYMEKKNEFLLFFFRNSSKCFLISFRD